MTPVLQSEQAVGQVIVYSDATNGGIIYTPRIIMDSLREQEIGTTKMLLQGEASYGLSKADVELIDKSFPGIVREPVSIRSVSLDDRLADLLHNHRYSLRLIPQLPFPKIVLSVTLDKIKDDYKTVYEKITGEWNNASLFDACLAIQFDCLDVSAMFIIEHDYTKIKQAREERLPITPVTASQVEMFIITVIREGTVGLSIVYGGDHAREIAVDVARTAILRAHFAKSSDGILLDDGTKIDLWIQNQFRPTDRFENIRGSQSKNVEHKLKI